MTAALCNAVSLALCALTDVACLLLNIDEEGSR